MSSFLDTFLFLELIESIWKAIKEILSNKFLSLVILGYIAVVMLIVGILTILS